MSIMSLSLSLYCIMILCCQIIGLVEHENSKRADSGKRPFRFADLYHSGNRTPTSTKEAGSPETIIHNLYLVSILFKVLKVLFFVSKDEP